MSDTITPQQISNTQYVSANTLSGIAVGDAMTLQNQSNSRMQIIVAASQPTANTYGEDLLVGRQGVVAAGNNEVWVISRGLGGLCSIQAV